MLSGATILPHALREDAPMVSLTTPPGAAGWPAAPFDLPGVDGRRHTLDTVRGPHGLVVMFICNHCPYVKAVLDKIVRDMADLRALGVGQRRDHEQRPGRLSGRFVREHARGRRAPPLRLSVRDRRDAGGREGVRRGLHARLLRLRPRLGARLPRTARCVGALAHSGRAARALCRDGRRRARRARADHAAPVDRMLDQVAPRSRRDAIPAGWHRHFVPGRRERPACQRYCGAHITARSGPSPSASHPSATI